MTARVFVDTNVLVYARDSAEPGKQTAAARWMAELWASRRGRLSVQVLQEYYATATRRLDPPRERGLVQADVLALFAWRPLQVGPALLERAWAVEERYGFSWWDAQIVAAALEAGCRYLLTEDLQDGQTVDDMTIINPFKHPVEAILGQVADGGG